MLARRQMMERESIESRSSSQLAASAYQPYSSGQISRQQSIAGGGTRSTERTARGDSASGRRRHPIVRSPTTTARPERAFGTAFHRSFHGGTLLRRRLDAVRVFDQLSN